MAEAIQEAGPKRGKRPPGIPVIASRLREQRLALKMTLSELAGTEVSRAFVHQIERGRSRPSMPVLLVLADRLQQPAEYFIDASAQAIGVDFSAALNRLARTMEMTDLPEGPYRSMIELIVPWLRTTSEQLLRVRRGSDPDIHPFTGEAETASASLSESEST